MATMENAERFDDKKILLTLFIGVLMGALDIAIVGPALPSIGRTFNAGAGELAWIFTIFVLFHLISTPISGRLSDQIGRRLMYIISVVIFAVGSLLVAVSGSLPAMLAGRAVQGLGSGGIFPVASAVIGDLFPPERRGRALGMIGAVFGVAFLLGPMLGGLLLPLGWPWLFYVNLPVAALVIALSLRHLPAVRRAQPRPFDGLGLALLAAGLIALTLGSNTIDPERFGASLRDPRVWAWFVAAALLFALFWRHQLRTPAPFVNPALLGSRQLRIAHGLALIAGVVEASLVFVPSLLVAAFGVDPSIASLLLLPAVLAMAIGAPVTGRMLDRHGSRRVLLLGTLALGLGLCAIRWATLSLASFYLIAVVIGIGLSSLVGAPVRYIVLNETPLEQRGSSQAVITLARSIGQMLGGVMIGAVIAAFKHGLDGFHVAYLVIGVLVLLGTLSAFGLKPQQRERRDAYA